MIFFLFCLGWFIILIRSGGFSFRVLVYGLFVVFKFRSGMLIYVVLRFFCLVRVIFSVVIFYF